MIKINIDMTEININIRRSRIKSVFEKFVDNKRTSFHDDIHLYDRVLAACQEKRPDLSLESENLNLRRNYCWLSIIRNKIARFSMSDFRSKSKSKQGRRFGVEADFNTNGELIQVVLTGAHCNQKATERYKIEF